MLNSPESQVDSEDALLLAVIEAEMRRRKNLRRYDWRGLKCPYLPRHGPGGYLEGECIHGRPDQVLPVGDWRLWLAKAGRGWGKTRVGAEAVREWSETNLRVNIVGPTMDDARDIMVEGESGIIACFPR